ncbi:MAG TPA: DNA-binding domain-containing protein [Rhizomicrobium sp.]
MSLFDLQRAFRDHILAGDDVPLNTVAPGAMRGLGVYRHAYRAQLVASLRDTFEKTWAWMGDEGFDTVARAHIARHPPQSWTLNDYGADFAGTVRALYPDDPEIAEIAWLDWRLRRAFEGPDADAIAPEKLGDVDWDSAVLIFLPTLTLGEVETNSAAIWGAIAEGEGVPAAKRLPQPGAIRVWRSGLTPRYRSIEMFEYRALVLAMAGSSFADLCTLLVENGDKDQAVQRVGTALAGWLQDGLISAVRQA